MNSYLLQAVIGISIVHVFLQLYYKYFATEETKIGQPIKNQSYSNTKVDKTVNNTKNSFNQFGISHLTNAPLPAQIPKTDFQIKRKFDSTVQTFQQASACLNLFQFKYFKEQQELEFKEPKSQISQKQIEQPGKYSFNQIYDQSSITVKSSEFEEGEKCKKVCKCENTQSAPVNDKFAKISKKIEVVEEEEQKMEDKNQKQMKKMRKLIRKLKNKKKDQFKEIPLKIITSKELQQNPQNSDNNELYTIEFPEKKKFKEFFEKPLEKPQPKQIEKLEQQDDYLMKKKIAQQQEKKTDNQIKLFGLLAPMPVEEQNNQTILQEKKEQQDKDETNLVVEIEREEGEIIEKEEKQEEKILEKEKKQEEQIISKEKKEDPIVQKQLFFAVNTPQSQSISNNQQNNMGFNEKQIQIPFPKKEGLFFNADKQLQQPQNQFSLLFGNLKKNENSTPSIITQQSQNDKIQNASKNENQTQLFLNTFNNQGQGLKEGAKCFNKNENEQQTSLFTGGLFGNATSMANAKKEFTGGLFQQNKQ